MTRTRAPRQLLTLLAIMAMNQGHGRLRASDADREQTIEVLKAAFVQNRLAKPEFEAHVGRALASRTYGELATVTANIPAPPIRVQPSSAPTSVREQRTRRKMSPDRSETRGPLGPNGR